MNLNVHIDKLDLDLRGIDPVLAEAAVRLLGPALEARLSGAATMHRGAGADAHALAHVLAQRVAERVASQLPSTSTKAEEQHAARRID